MFKKITLCIFILFSIVIIGWMQLKDPLMGSKNIKVASSLNNKDTHISKGIELYANNCSSCHMGNLAGNPEWKFSLDEDGQRLPPPLNGKGHTWHHAPEQLFNIIRYGYKKIDPNYKGKMLGNENLSDNEIWSILEYIKGEWPKNIKTKYESNFGG